MTSKERNLLFVLAGVLVLVLIWTFAYKPLRQRTNDMRQEMINLEDQYNALNIKYLQKDKFLEENETLSVDNARIRDEFPLGESLTQEMIIFTMKDIETTIASMSLPSYTMGDMTVVSTYDANKAIVETTEGAEGSEQEDKVDGAQEIFFSVPVQVNTQVTYNDLKKLLDYIETYNRKLSIENLTMVADLDADLVSASFTLNFYGLFVANEPGEIEQFFGDFEPKLNSVFRPYPSFGITFETGPKESVVKEEPDFYMSLSSVFADRSTVIMYKNNDANDSTYLYADGNESLPVEIVFEKRGDIYFFKYEVDGKRYPLNYNSGSTFVPGDKLILHVFSSPRMNTDDVSGVSATITNTTDLPLVIEVESDDKTNPRFVLESSTGDVQVER